MRKLLPDQRLFSAIAVELAMNPVISGPQLDEHHSRMLQHLLSGNCGDVVLATGIIDDLLVSAMVLLEKPKVTADDFIKALELLLFRTKLHSKLCLFYHCDEDLLL